MTNVNGYFNHYSKRDLGQSTVIEGVVYNFDKPILKNGKIKQYKYIASPNAEQRAIKDVERKAMQDAEVEFMAIDCAEIIKKINRFFGGHITARSPKSEAIYSKLNNGKTVRVAKHNAYCKRSETDISVYAYNMQWYVNDIEIDSENLVVNAIKTIESILVKN